MKKVFMVSHTHWDREWYKSRQFFRTKLVYMISHLLDLLENDPEFKHFMLDGQTIVLEDYLAIRPEDRSRLMKFIAQRRIAVGPWYIQPDEFAPDAESLVRNLLIGIEQARCFGGGMSVGYLPDSFGHSAQMPQILRGFGIDSAVVMRGVDEDKAGATEFLWQGLDGSKVLTVYLATGYSNTMFLSKNNEINEIRVKTNIRALESRTRVEQVLLMNGVDHAFAQGQAASLCRQQPGWTQGSMEQYIDLIKSEDPELNTVEKELITPHHHRVHTSIASTRIDQKRQNRLLSTRLKRTAEPLLVMAALQGARYPRELLAAAWKLLIQNQTHDGICGCCTDEVHKEMDQRFVEVRQISETLIKNHARAFACKASGQGLSLTVFSTSLTTGIHVVEATAFMEEGFRLVDESGKDVPYQIHSIEEVDFSKSSIWTLYLGTSQMARKITFRFLCNFTAFLGVRHFKLDPAPVPSAAPVSKEEEFENSFYKLEFNPDGTLALTDKETNFFYPSLVYLEDRGEGGDSYNHSPLKDDRVILSRGVKADIERVREGALGCEFRIQQTLSLPKGLSEDGNARSEDKVDLTVETLVRVYHHSRRIDFTLEINNTALSHRLRVLFPFGGKVDCSYAETQFGVLERPCAPPVSNAEWPEVPLPIYSMQRFAGLKDSERSLFVLNRGLQEFEVYREKESVLALTLHRGVSFMGRTDLAVRPGRPSGMEISTPGAESIGLLEREYSLLIGGNMSFHEITAEADRYTSPPLAVQNRINIDNIRKAHGDFFGALSVDNLTSVIADKIKNLPEKDHGYLKLSSTKLAVSAVKLGERDNSVVVRLYNPSETAVSGESLEINFPHGSVYRTNLGEEDREELFGGDLCHIPEVSPFSQITLLITREVQ